MIPSREGRPWRLILGTIAFTAWAPPSLLGLPFAGLMVAARPRSRVEWGVALAVGLAGVGLLLLPANDLLTGAVRAYVVLVTAAFLAVTLLAPPGTSVLQLAVRASLLAGLAEIALVRLGLGRAAWDALHWEATRQASTTMRFMVEIEPRVFAVFEPVVRFVSGTVPAVLALQALAGLALAWQWHRRVAQQPLGASLGPFREFRFADHWVWAVVAALTVCVTPILAGVKGAALNLLVALGALYLLRGAAIVVAFAAALGVAPAALLVGAAVAALLAVPLLLIVPGLATLGITDTWLEFRRRLRAPA